MDKNYVNFWLSMNAVNFDPADLIIIKGKLEELDDNKLLLLQSASFQKPSIILIIAIFLGWERFWLDDIGLGVVKIITCYGCGIWWLVDIFSAQRRAQKYNMQQFIRLTGIAF
jgi:hypothetical protein